MQATLVFLFFIGMLGDAYTTFLGILGAMGTEFGNYNNTGSYIFAVIGTSVIIGLNIFTIDVFERKEKIIFFFWFPAVVIDFIASLVGSFGFIRQGANPVLAYGLVFFITIFITASPGLLRYFMENPID